jgi:hypothetical protein
MSQGIFEVCCSRLPQTWFEWLPLAEYWYNTAYHSTLYKTPFEVLYGQKPRHLGLVSGCQSPDLETWLTERVVMLESCVSNFYVPRRG